MVSLREVKMMAIGSLILVVLLLLTLAILLFYYLSYLITGPGSILISLVCLWLLLRLAVRILVFPGSCWFWKRSIEASFCVEMSNQVYYKVRDLRLYLQSIQNQERFSYQTNSSVLIDSLLDRLKSMNDSKKFSKSQENLYKRLIEIKTSLQETIVIVNSADSFTVWDWVQEKANKPEPQDIVFEDYPDCLQVKKAIKYCTDLENGLFKSCGAAKFSQKIKRWLFDDTIGTIHYLREDMVRRFNCEQVWVTCGKFKIDW